MVKKNNKTSIVVLASIFLLLVVLSFLVIKTPLLLSVGLIEIPKSNNCISAEFSENL